MTEPLEDLPACWDALVVGAGPAGGMTAYCLAGSGLQVLFIERETFPRFKVCGCCLNQAALSVLQRAGLGFLPDLLGARTIERFDLKCEGKTLRLPLPEGRAVSRRSFDSALVRQARGKGAVFVDGVSARLMQMGEQSCRIRLRRRGGEERYVKARTVVCADGLAGTFLKGFPEFESRVTLGSKVGIATVLPPPAHVSDAAISMALSSRGYVGQVRLEDGSVNVAAAVEKEALRADSPAQVVEDIVADAGGATSLERQRAEWKGTPPLNRRRQSLSGRRLFIVGDAAGYIEPFTGEGIAWALGGALLLAPIARASVEEWTPSLAEDWQRTYRRRIRSRQLLCRVLQKGWNRPHLAAVLISLAGRWSPRCLKPVVWRLNRPLPELL